MKKKILMFAMLGVLAASGSGGEKEKKDTKENKPADLSSNPDYQKGLDAVNRNAICGTCHLVDTKLTGPAWRDVANKYPVDSFSYLVNKIQNGGVGVWGTTPMPANTSVTREDIEAIVKYIFLLKNK